MQLADEFERYSEISLVYWLIEKHAPIFKSWHYSLVNGDHWNFSRRVRLYMLDDWENILSKEKKDKDLMIESFKKYFPYGASYYKEHLNLNKNPETIFIRMQKSLNLSIVSQTNKILN
jgi:hypothetical protein